MKNCKKTVTTLLTVAVLLMVVFAAGRYGWKLLGFRACQGAGIESVEVSENTVKIKGFYPGSFPEGFCGYYAEEQDGTLYVGFRFSTVFGFLKRAILMLPSLSRARFMKLFSRQKTAPSSLPSVRMMLTIRCWEKVHSFTMWRSLK